MNEKTQNVPAVQDDDEITIDVLDLLRQLLIHWKLILICMILCGGAACGPPVIEYLWNMPYPLASCLFNDPHIKVIILRPVKLRAKALYFIYKASPRRGKVVHVIQRHKGIRRPVGLEKGLKAPF